jgi:[acyl-carrier-protein] S-malonyltransferase
MSNASNTAFLFPGQGSQSLGMLHALAEQHACVGEVFELVSDTLGYDLWRLIQEGPLEQLNQTEYTQVAMLAGDVAVYRVLESYGINADYSAGHSLGEYAALVCAGALQLADAARLVQARGRLMQETVPLGKGAMAAIVGLSDAQVQAICHEVSTETMQVSPANYNAIGQVVIAGHTAAVHDAMRQADMLEARLTREIPVSVPCHCSLLSDAALKFKKILDETPFFEPKRRIINNVDVSAYTSPDMMRASLAEQLYSPVRWVETIQAMEKFGVTEVIECGPGRVLTGLAKRIDRTLAAYSVNSPDSLASILSLKGITP